MAVWTEWDPLKEIIVGDCYNPGELDWAIDDPTARDHLNVILRDTKEDLDNLSLLLTNLDVIVKRPKIKVYSGPVNFSEFSVKFPTAPVVPRDQYLIYGDTIYQTYTSMSDRYIDSINYYEIFKEIFDRGANWISQPPPILPESKKNYRWWDNGLTIYQSLKDRLLWHTASAFKCGDSLIINTAGPGTDSGLEWFKRNSPDTNIITNNNTILNNWGHIDQGFFMVDDNIVFCDTLDWVPLCLRDKTVVELSSYLPNGNAIDMFSKFHRSEGQYSVGWLSKMQEWRGYSQNVSFLTNALVVNRSTIIFNEYVPELFDFLKINFNIQSYASPVRHPVFWEAGIHCLTLDIRRDGSRRSIIKNIYT